MEDPGVNFFELISSDFPNAYNSLNIPIAFANEKKMIVWASNKFEQLVDSNLKNVDFLKLFNINKNEFSKNSTYKEENLFWSLDISYRDQNVVHPYYILYLTEKTKSDNKLMLQVSGIKTFAHDLNNILTSINSSSTRLKNKNLTDDESSNLINNIETNSHRAADIIQQVLSKGLDKKTIRKKVDLKKLLSELYNSLESTVGVSIKLVFNVDEGLHQITANYSDIYRILLNLCLNASEAIGRNGKIIVTAANVSESIETLKSSSNAVRITVEDNGSGIRRKHIDKIFTQGFSTKNKFRDSGLGLHIVKNLVEEHSGKIEVTSRWLRGTKFSIYLPARELYEKSDLTSDTNATILIADDEESILELLADLLESYNYKVICAKNGDEVIKEAKKNNQIDLMIIDRKMPVMSGLESIKILRENNYTKPIILTTGSQSSKTNFDPDDYSVNKVMIKPYDFEQILLEVKSLLK